MHFGNIHMLYIIGWIIPALIFFYILTGRRRRKAMEAFAQRETLGKVTLFYSKRVYVAGVILTLFAVISMIIAMARPQWDFYWKENKRKGLDIVIGVDVSRSMIATDLSPNRLAFVKYHVGEFVKALKGDRVGLIAFSGSAFLQCPLTVDYRGYLLALNSLDPISVSRGGTAISSAIKEAVRCYQGAETPYKIFIIISDGEHHEGDIDKAINMARNAGITIYCIGVGTTQGTILYDTDDKGESAPVKDEYGKAVVTRLDEKTLIKIASKTGGLYIRSTEKDFGLSSLYSERFSKLEKRESEDEKVKVYQDKFQYPLALACLLLIAGMIIKERSDE